jgi:hypothetical protein
MLVDTLFKQNKFLWFNLMERRQFSTLLTIFEAYAESVGTEILNPVIVVLEGPVETSAERMARVANGQLRISV